MRDARKIAELAEGAFWEAVVKAVPQAKTGDLPPDVALAFTEMAERAVQAWIDENTSAEASATVACKVSVILRAPRKGERCWWVLNVSDPDAALREVLQESEELGFVALDDYRWFADENGMYPITVIVEPALNFNNKED